MNSPLKRDVVKEFTDAFRANGLKVMLYYSILDTHDRLRPGFITRKHVDMIKAQLTELLTHYGKIEALIIDGWDAPWSGISYDEVPFDEIYHLVKSLQPDCLLMDLNMITIMEPHPNIRKYTLQYQENGEWKTIFSGGNTSRFKLHRFDTVWGNKVRIQIDNSSEAPSISEMGVYFEQR